jgi:hypothetical protein
MNFAFLVFDVNQGNIPPNVKINLDKQISKKSIIKLYT